MDGWTKESVCREAAEETEDQSHTPGREMANFSGTWKMRSSENFDELLKALGEEVHSFLLGTERRRSKSQIILDSLAVGARYI